MRVHYIFFIFVLASKAFAVEPSEILNNANLIFQNGWFLGIL